VLPRLCWQQLEALAISNAVETSSTMQHHWVRSTAPSHLQDVAVQLRQVDGAIRLRELRAAEFGLEERALLCQYEPMRCASTGKHTALRRQSRRFCRGTELLMHGMI
jgi:hypothetical protein